MTIRYTDTDDFVCCCFCEYCEFPDAKGPKSICLKGEIIKNHRMQVCEKWRYVG